jgi:hypothetical protein
MLETGTSLFVESPLKESIESLLRLPETPKYPNEYTHLFNFKGKTLLLNLEKYKAWR